MVAVRCARVLALLVLTGVAALLHGEANPPARAQIEPTPVEDDLTPDPLISHPVYLPVLDFLGDDDICESWLTIFNVGAEPAVALSMFWGEPGFCPPQAAGPINVRCSGLIRPWSSWWQLGAQIPTGSKSGVILRFEDRVVRLQGGPHEEDQEVRAADWMCRFISRYSLIEIQEEPRALLKAYSEGLQFDGIDMREAAGQGQLVVDVQRDCLLGGSAVEAARSAYAGGSGRELGIYDPHRGGLVYDWPLVVTDASDERETWLYLQNAGYDCSRIQIWFRPHADCATDPLHRFVLLASSESHSIRVSDVVGADWRGSVRAISSAPLIIAADLVGPSGLASYRGVALPLLSDTIDAEHLRDHAGAAAAVHASDLRQGDGWKSRVTLLNRSERLAGRITLHFVAASGQGQTLVDWLCPLQARTYDLGQVADLPAEWRGSLRVESRPAHDAVEGLGDGTRQYHWPYLAGVVEVERMDDPEGPAYAAHAMETRGVLEQGIDALVGLESAPETQIGSAGMLVLPRLRRDASDGVPATHVALLAPEGHRATATTWILDQNGLVDRLCLRLSANRRVDLSGPSLGFLPSGFVGSAVVSSSHWTHPDGIVDAAPVASSAVSFEDDRIGRGGGSGGPRDGLRSSRAFRLDSVYPWTVLAIRSAMLEQFAGSGDDCRPR